MTALVELEAPWHGLLLGLALLCKTHWTLDSNLIKQRPIVELLEQRGSQRGSHQLALLGLLTLPLTMNLIRPCRPPDACPSCQHLQQPARQPDADSCLRTCTCTRTLLWGRCFGSRQRPHGGSIRASHERASTCTRRKWRLRVLCA